MKAFSFLSVFLSLGLAGALLAKGPLFSPFKTYPFLYDLSTNHLKFLGCGDGILALDEQCEDGNNVSRDGCSASCVLECLTACLTFCGDGIITPGEVCDDGNLISGDSCDATCQVANLKFDPEETLCYACGFGGGCLAILTDETSCSSLFSDPLCSGTCDEGETVLIDPTDADIAVCEDPTSAPPESRIREYSESTHISRCETETSVRYTICGESGEVTVNIISCLEGDPCEEGACIDTFDSVDRFCLDTDPANDVYIRGEIVGVNTYGDAYTVGDVCSPVSDYVVREQTCDADGISSSGYISVTCPEGERCVDATCEPIVSCTQTCADSDPVNDVHVLGTVTGIDSFCDAYTSDDACWGSDEVREKICNADGTTDFITITCPEGERCDNGICETIVSCTPTCVDSDLANDIYVRGETVGVDSSCDAYTRIDICSGWANVFEEICNADGTPDRITVPCPEGERCTAAVGVCEPVCTRTECSRTEATATEAGFVTDINCVVQHDICDGTNLTTFTCGADGLPAVSETITCASGCADGRCL